MDRYEVNDNSSLEIAEENCTLESEELLLRNTFVNAQMFPVADYAQVNVLEDKSKAIRWIDEETNNEIKLASEGDIDLDLINLEKPAKIVIHRRNRPTKPLLKTRSKQELPGGQMQFYPQNQQKCENQGDMMALNSDI